MLIGREIKPSSGGDPNLWIYTLPEKYFCINAAVKLSTIITGVLLNHFLPRDEQIWNYHALIILMAVRSHALWENMLNSNI